MALGSALVPEVVAPEGRPKVSPSSSGGSSVFEEIIGWEEAFQRRHNSAVAATVATTEAGTTNIAGRVASS